MKRILFVIPTLGQGGAEKVLVNLVNHINKELFDVTVLTLFDVGVNKSFLNKDVHYKSVMKEQFIGNTWFLKLFSPTFLYKKIIKDKYDIIVSYLEGPTARIVSGCDDKDIKLVSWVHVEQHDMKTLSRAFRSQKEARWSYNKFDQTVCVSNFVKDDFCRILGFTKPCMVLYNTVETEKILSDAEDNEERLGHNNSFKMIAVGTLKASKGYERLLHIVKLLKSEYSIHLYVLGIGPLKDKLQNYINTNDLEEQVTLLGYDKNPYKYIKKCDLFVCASYAEGFSTATTEALVLGIPVCTVDVSGMKEMLGENNEFGIVTENNTDALYHGIKRLLNDHKLLLFYRKKAKERGKVFSTQKTVYAVEQMLRDL